MADNLFNALSEFDDSVTQYVRTYSGLLGLPTSNKTVEVPTRNGYVYVRLRDNQSEIIQAYNEKVSPVYNLPVLVRREGSKWVIQGRDIERYENWGSYSAFLPAHAPQHEFDRDNMGGDIVFSYIDQLMPVLAYPSGTDGSGNVLIGGYSFKKNDNTWAYVGNTGTPSLLIYKPVDNQARVVLVYLDRNTGNPGILVNSGTSFSAALTGTHDVLQYIPTFTPVQEPVKVVRLVSGTEQIKWDNLYDVRQFLGGGVTGTGGSSTPAGSDTEIQINQAGAFGANYNWRYDYTNDVLIYGSGTPPTSAAKTFHIMQDQGSPGLFMWAWQSNSAVAPYIAGFKARGTRDAPQAIQKDDEIFRIRARGYNGVNYTATQSQLLFVAPFNWASGSHPLYASVWVTPSGSAQMQEIVEFTPSGPNLQAAKTYNISGSPHVHYYSDVMGTFLAATVGATGTASTCPFKSALNTTTNSFPWPVAGTLKNLTVRISTAQPASGSMVITLYVDNVATSIVLTIPAGSGVGTYSDSVNTVSFAAGSIIRWDVLNNATATSATITAITMQLESTTT